MTWPVNVYLPNQKISDDQAGDSNHRGVVVVVVVVVVLYQTSHQPPMDLWVFHVAHARESIDPPCITYCGVYPLQVAVRNSRSCYPHIGTWPTPIASANPPIAECVNPQIRSGCHNKNGLTTPNLREIIKQKKVERSEEREKKRTRKATAKEQRRCAELRRLGLELRSATQPRNKSEILEAERRPRSPLTSASDEISLRKPPVALQL